MCSAHIEEKTVAQGRQPQYFLARIFSPYQKAGNARVVHIISRHVHTHIFPLIN